jgi:hypothetical protein
MSNSSAVETLKQNIVAFAQIPIVELKSSSTGIGEWAGLSYPEYVVRIDQLIGTLTEIGKYLPLEQLPYATLTSRSTEVYEALAAAQQFMRERSAENFQIAARFADQLYSQLMTFGFVFPGNAQSKLTALVAQIEPELSKLRTANEEAKNIEESLRGLFTPVVSNTLSAAFSKREKQVRSVGYIWAAVAVAIGVAAIYVTFHSLDQINQELAERFKLIQNGKPMVNSTDAFLITQMVLRSAILIPLYLLFALCFSQYRRERNFEEEYAHKAAVAATIPIYGEIVRTEGVRDQIVSAASAVIFSSPSKDHGKASDDKNAPETLKGISAVIDSVDKLTSKK